MPLVTESYDLTAFRFYEDDGSESAASAIAAQNTNISRNVLSAPTLSLRVRVQESGGASGATTDDWQLQYSKNSGTWTNVTSGSSNVTGFNSANLADGGATTNRLGAGSGSFVAGKISEDGLLDDSQLTASNYTEFLYTLSLVSADVADGDTLDFRVLHNATVFDVYTRTPRITINKTSSGPRLLSLLGAGT